jgi:hypothetical protein
MERTHLLRDDLDWLPPSYKALRWTVAGTVWTGIFGGLTALFVLTKFQGAYFFGKGVAALAAGGYFAGDRAARAALRLRLKRLAHGAVDLSRLPAEPDGELVHVSGRVRARATIPSLLGEPPGVYRRLRFCLPGDDLQLVHEAACDFWLVADDSEPVLVDVQAARLLVGDIKIQHYDAQAPVTRNFQELRLPETVQLVMIRREKRRARGKSDKLQAGELMLRDGDRIEILGYKSRTVDPTVHDRLERETPFRATLRGGRELPLLIAPID